MILIQLILSLRSLVRNNNNTNNNNNNNNNNNDNNKVWLLKFGQQMHQFFSITFSSQLQLQLYNNNNNNNNNLPS